MVKFNIYSLVASCKATTFTKVDQVEENVNLVWLQNCILHSLKMQKISTSMFLICHAQKV